MANFFSFDSKAAQFFSRLWDLFVLNFFFILGSLPIITFGVSAIAAYTVALRIVENREDSIAIAFFRAYKANLKQGVMLTLGFLLAAAAVFTDFMLFEKIENNPIIFAIAGVISTVLVFVHFFYVFALAARYKGSLFHHMTNSRNIFFKFYGRSFLCALLVFFEVWLFAFNGWLLFYVGVFIAPILIITTKSFFAMKFFRALETEDTAVAEESSDSGAILEEMIDKNKNSLSANT